MFSYQTAEKGLTETATEQRTELFTSNLTIYKRSELKIYFELRLQKSMWHLVTSPIIAGLSGIMQDIWFRVYDEATNTFGAYIV